MGHRLDMPGKSVLCTKQSLLLHRWIRKLKKKDGMCLMSLVSMTQAAAAEGIKEGSIIAQ